MFCAVGVRIIGVRMVAVSVGVPRPNYTNLHLYLSKQVPTDRYGGDGRPEISFLLKSPGLVPGARSRTNDRSQTFPCGNILNRPENVSNLHS